MSYNKQGGRDKAAAFAVIILIAMAVSGIGGFGTVRSGTRMMYVSSEGPSFWKASYQYFDGYISRKLWVDAEGFLDVSVDTEEGRIGMEIKDAEGNILYQKSDMGSCKFSLPAEGKVSILIQLDQHKGGFEIR